MERRSFSCFVQVDRPYTLREQKKLVVLVPRPQFVHSRRLYLFEDWLYWTDWKADAVLKCNKRGNTTAMVVQADLTLPLVIQAVHRAVQAPGEEGEGREGR